MCQTAPTQRLLPLLTGDTDSLTVTAGGASLLATHTETPAVAETTVGADFPEALEGVTHLGVEQVSIHMGGLAILDVLLPVDEPGRHELQWFWMTATILSISSVESSPARLLRSTSAFLHTMKAKRRPTPLMAVRAKGALWRPSTLVLRIRRMCWNWSWGKISAMAKGTDPH